MSSLWTPGGERPVSRPSDQGSAGGLAGGGASGPGGPGAAGAGPGPGTEREPTEAEMREHMAELRDQLANTPAEIVIANHAYGLFELAALHLSLERPQLDQARLAIDALGYLVEGLGDRLGEPAGELGSALGQLRMAFVQIQAGLAGGGGPGDGAGGAPGDGAGGGPDVSGQPEGGVQEP